MSETPAFEIDGALVAHTLGLEVTEFRRLMSAGKIPVLCERGEDEDAGRVRASFYHGRRRARFLLADGCRPLPVDQGDDRQRPSRTGSARYGHPDHAATPHALVDPPPGSRG